MERRDYDIKMMELIEFEIKEIDKKIIPLIKKKNKIESKINHLNTKKTFFNKLYEDHKCHVRHEELLDIRDYLKNIDADTFFKYFKKLIGLKIKEYFEYK